MMVVMSAVVVVVVYLGGTRGQGHFRWSLLGDFRERECVDVQG